MACRQQLFHDLLHKAVGLSVGLLHLLVQCLKPLAEKAGRADDDEPAGDCQQGKGRLHGGHHPHGGDQPGQQGGHIGDQGDHTAVDGLHVAGETVDQFPAVIGRYRGIVAVQQRVRQARFPLAIQRGPQPPAQVLRRSVQHHDPRDHRRQQQRGPRQLFRRPALGAVDHLPGDHGELHAQIGAGHFQQRQQDQAGNISSVALRQKMKRRFMLHFLPSLHNIFSFKA